MNVRYAASALCIMAVGFVGCGDDEESEGDSGGNVAAEAQALLSPVRDALDNPTGSLDEATAPDVFAALFNQEAAGEAAAYVPGAAPPPSSPQADAPGSNCIQASGAGGTMDMDCLTGGVVTGTLTYQASGTGDPIYVVYSYDDVCVVESDTCLDGDGAQELSGNLAGGVYDVILAGNFTVTSAGSSFALQYGYKLIVDGQNISIEYVVFTEDGNSYTVTLSTDGATTTWTLTGANGTFECTTADGGATGTCTGGGEFSW